MTKEYVAGFMFDDHNRVALVKKLKPEWQKGKFNGIGGKVEVYDANARAAMVREFREETGAVTLEEDWTLFCTLLGVEPFDPTKTFRVYFFSAKTKNLLPTNERDGLGLRTMEAEEIHVLEIPSVTFGNAVPNLQWLIPMAKSIALDGADKFVVQEIR